MAYSFCMDKNEMPGLHIVEHPLVQHKLTQMRQKDTTSQVFRTLLNEISLLLAYEVTRELPIKELEIETPLVKTKMPYLSEMPSVVSILRAGNGLLEGVLQVIPNARVGHVGLYRDHETLEAVEYYCKFPPLNGGMTIVVDPMLATGNSACAALTRVKEENPASVRFLCLLAAPEGVKALNTEHPLSLIHI